MPSGFAASTFESKLFNCEVFMAEGKKWPVPPNPQWFSQRVQNPEKKLLR